ncbi:hypothetical protein IFM89_009609 [Coptis chinensis]|uniref:Endonuclease/exonuclease/phosphatase domain-containing protein n=1 Tax=Coptis chinensis TaxID=261450 RepID=A0A835IQL8_9MAGN|nr:hypothetical protein IFM89_009609 [Coptis chinensis]
MHPTFKDLDTSPTPTKPFPVRKYKPRLASSILKGQPIITKIQNPTPTTLCHTVYHTPQLILEPNQTFLPSSDFIPDTPPIEMQTTKLMFTAVPSFIPTEQTHSLVPTSISHHPSPSHISPTSDIELLLGGKCSIPIQGMKKQKLDASKNQVILDVNQVLESCFFQSPSLKRKFTLMKLSEDSSTHNASVSLTEINDDDTTSTEISEGADLLKKIRKFRPEMILIVETQVKSPKISQTIQRQGFVNYFHVPSNGRSGGMSLLWTNNLSVNIEQSDSWIIHGTAHCIATPTVTWTFSGIYAHPKHQGRKLQWQLLSAIGIHIRGPWAIFGDFNKVLSQEDKIGGVPVTPGRKNFIRWKADVFGNSAKKICEIEEILTDIHQTPPSARTRATDQREKALAKILANLVLREERHWAQRANTTWHQDSDDNTKFFHMSVIINRQAHGIVAIKDTAGLWQHEEEAISKVFVEHFHKSFDKSDDDLTSTIFNSFTSRVSALDNIDMIKIPKEEEIKVAAFQIAANKSAGPDGFTGNPHSTVDFKHSVRSVFGIKKQLPITTYLGSPTCLSRVTSKSFHPILLRLQQRLRLWKASTFSQAGRLTLINAVCSAIPNHQMAVFKLPEMITQPIDVHRRAFLWGHDINTRSVHSVNWDTIEKPKMQGGLGVHNLQHTNLALLAKKAWAVIASSKSLWVDIVKAKYLRKHDFLTMRPNPTDSRVGKISSKLAFDPT